MNGVRIFDVNDTTEGSVTVIKEFEDGEVVLISSDVEEHRSSELQPLHQQLAKSFSDSLRDQEVDDEDVVLLNDTDRLAFSFEVEGDFQDDTMIESEIEVQDEPRIQVQSQVYQRSQTQLLDDIENSRLSLSLFSDGEHDTNAIVANSAGNRNIGADQGNEMDISVVHAPPSSPSLRLSQRSNYIIASSPTVKKSECLSRMKRFSESPSTGPSKQAKRSKTKETIAPRFNAELSQNLVISSKDTRENTSSVALDLTKYMEEFKDSYGSMTSDANTKIHETTNAKVSINRAECDEGHDSIVVDSDNEAERQPAERPLFVQHSSQSTPVAVNKVLQFHDQGESEETTLDITTRILHTKNFTDQEYNSMVKTCLSTAESKKRYNECNKVSRTEEMIYNEMILTVNQQITELIHSKHISLSEELKPLTIIQNYEEFPIIRFKRKCTSVYDQTHGIFYPCDEVILDEHICVLVYEALQFFHRYRTNKKGLWDEIRQFSKRRIKVVVVIYGQNALRKKLCNLDNRQHEDKVLEQLPGSPSSQSQSKTKRKSAQEAKLKELNMRAKDLERIVNEVIVYANVDVFPIENLNEFSYWLKNLVWVVGKMRYDVSMKHKEWSHLSVKSGKNPADVLLTFLQQIAHVNEPKAKRVVSHYKSFQSLRKDMQRGYVVSGNDNKPLMAKPLERALHTLYNSDNPDELIFTD